MDLIEQHRHELTNACVQNQVEELYAFGSILNDSFNSDSDIDFIVSINSDDPLEYAEHYFDLKFELENIFRRKIDLLEQNSIKNKLFEELVNDNKALVYARGN